MVIHTKKKARIHTHEPKKAKIKGSNIYTVERAKKTARRTAVKAKVTDAKVKKANVAEAKKSYRKSTVHPIYQTAGKDKETSRFKRNIRESNVSIKTKQSNLHIAGRTGVVAAGAVNEQLEGGQEISQAAYLAYEVSRPVTGTASRGAELFKRKAAAEAKKRIKIRKVEAGKQLSKRAVKKTAKDTAKTVAKETTKETAKATAKATAKTAAKATAAAAGTAVAPGVGTAIGIAAGYAAGVAVEAKDTQITNRNSKLVVFKNCIFEQTIFSQANFENCMFDGCRFQGFEFFEIIFCDVTFKNCSFQDILFNKCSFQSVLFECSNYINVSINPYEYVRGLDITETIKPQLSSELEVILQKAKLQKYIRESNTIFKKVQNTWSKETKRELKKISKKEGDKIGLTKKQRLAENARRKKQRNKLLKESYEKSQRGENRRIDKGIISFLLMKYSQEELIKGMEYAINNINFSFHELSFLLKYIDKGL